jgi:type I restriction enzyme M protein
MPFNDFQNPFQDPAKAPEAYRKHSSLSKLFRADGSYVRRMEDPVTLWAIHTLNQEYGVPLEAMELEAVATTAKTDKTSRQAFARADLIIYDDRYVGAVGLI